MKKWYFLGIIFLIIFMVSCGENKEEQKVINPTISLNENDITIKVGETYEVQPLINIQGEDLFLIKGENQSVVEINGNTIKGLKQGATNLNVVLKSDENKFVILSVTVKTDSVPVFNLEGVEQNETIDQGSSFDTLNGIKATDIEDGNITSKISVKGAVDTNNLGEYVLEYEVIDKDGNVANFSRKITVIPLDITAPVISLVAGSPEILELEYLANYDLSDIVANDETDGDLTSSIKLVAKHNSQRYNVQTVKVSVKDKHGNETVFERKVQVIWPYKTMVIGHAGSYYGSMNSEEAILNAAKTLHYQAIEIDLAQTSDGVFVLSHDADFNKVNIAGKKYEDLVKVVKTETRAAGFPKEYGLIPNKTGSYSSTICTLERYLNICKEYGIYAVIELKDSKGITNSDQTRMPALMEVIKKCNMLDHVIFLASNYNTLIWVKTHGYESVPCQYLVGSCEKQSVLNTCIEYQLDVSICVTYGDYSNSDEWLAKYRKNGCKISTYTFSQYNDASDVQTWIDKGVDFVTCDWCPLIRLNFIRKDA